MVKKRYFLILPVVLIGLVIHVVYSQAATEVGIGFDTASSSTSNSQSATTEPTSTSSSISSNTSSSSSSSSINDSTTGGSLIGGVVSIDRSSDNYRETRVVRRNAGGDSKRLPKTGENNNHPLIIFFGCLCLVIASGLLIGRRRKINEE